MTAPRTSLSTNMSPRWGCTLSYHPFYKYAAPLGLNALISTFLQICRPVGAERSHITLSTNMPPRFLSQISHLTSHIPLLNLFPLPIIQSNQQAISVLINLQAPIFSLLISFPGSFLKKERFSSNIKLPTIGTGIFN